MKRPCTAAGLHLLWETASGTIPRAKRKRTSGANRRRGTIQGIATAIHGITMMFQGLDWRCGWNPAFLHTGVSRSSSHVILYVNNSQLISRVVI